MVLYLTPSGILAFAVTVVLLIVYSIMDLRERKVSNTLMGLGFVVSLVSGFVFWHLPNQLPLHIMAVIVVFLITFVLYRIRAVGGADIKAAFIIAVTSPGIEFTAYDIYMFEAIIGAALQLLVMLLLGYFYYIKMKDSPERKPAPLIPFLLIGYLLVQLLAFI